MLFRLGWAVFIVALATGCCDPKTEDCEEKDTDPTLLDPSECPDGYVTASTSAALANPVSLDGAGVFTAHISNQQTDFGWSSCFKTDGTGGRWILTAAEQPFVRITIESSTAGSQDPQGKKGALTIELLNIEDETPIYKRPNYQSGTWFVNSVGKEFDVDIDVVGQLVTKDAPTHRLFVKATLVVTGNVE